MKDVFISHASEDKELVVRPLSDSLIAAGLDVWLDEYELRVGDSLRRSIETGLSNSRFGIVILSPAFFAKEWPKRELDALVSREADGSKIVLPIWHNVDAQLVATHAPLLVDKYALRSSVGIDDLTAEILRAVGVATRPGSISVFSYRPVRATSADLTNFDLSYIHACFENDLVEISIHCKRDSTYDPQFTREQWLAVGSALWQPITSIAGSLGGWTDSAIIPSRWRLRDTGGFIERRFIPPEGRGLTWGTFSVLIHLRDWMFFRDIDHDLIDLFIIPETTRSGEPYSHDEADESTASFLQDIQGTLELALTEIARVASEDFQLRVRLSPPLWQDECVPVLGSDGYWLRGVIV